MINNPQVSSAQSAIDGGLKHQTYGSRVFSWTAMAVLLVSAAVAMVVTGPAQLNQGATAQSGGLVQAAQLGQPLTMPLDSGEVGPFAFGFLVFEDDRDNGVPGFGPLPPSSAR